METDTEITVNQSDVPAPSVCRCCLADGCYKDILAEYFWMGKREVYADMLIEAFNITIPYSKSDSQSNTRLICEQCITRLRDAADFKQQIIQSEKTFHEHLDTTFSEISELDLEEKPLVKKEKKEIDESDDAIDFPDFSPDNNDDDDDDDEADNLPLTKIASKSPKKEKIETITLKSITSPKVAIKRPVTSSLVPPPIKRLKLPTTPKELPRNIIIKKVVGAPLNQRIQQSTFVRKVMGKPPPSLTTKMSRTLPVSSTKILSRLPSNAKKLIKPGTTVNVVRQVVGGGKTIMRQAGGTQLVIKPQAPKKVSTSTAKPSTSDAKAPVKKALKREERKDIARENAVIILRHSTAYPFQQSGFSFRCCQCRKNFDDPDLFRVHMDTDHEGVDRSTAVKHRNDSLTRVDVTNLKCRICNSNVVNLETLAYHLNEVHSLGVDMSQDLGIVPFKLEKDRFQCFICEKIFSNMKQLSRHCGSHFSRNICDTCGQNFETLRGLEYHVRFSHSKHPFICRTCGMDFSTLEAKKEHAVLSKRCHGFSCNICGDRFRNANIRQEHLEKVHGMPKIVYKCSECGAVFERRMMRYLHFKEKHTDDNKCGCCSMRFSTRRRLQEHISREHTGERPHKCTVCHKTFIAFKGLRRHEVIHDDSKKVVCPVCGRLFAVRTRLKQHMFKHHKDVYAKEFPENVTSS